MFSILFSLSQIFFRLFQTQMHVYGALQVFSDTDLLKVGNLIA